MTLELLYCEVKDGCFSHRVPDLLTGARVPLRWLVSLELLSLEIDDWSILRIDLLFEMYPVIV